MRRLALFLLCCCLALPTLGAEAARQNRQEQFGELTVHYNAITSSILQPGIAKAAGLMRSKNLGVLNVAVEKAGKSFAAAISGTVSGPNGKKENLTFTQVTEQGAVSYVTQFQIPQDATYTFDLSIKAAGDTNRLSFDQELFPGDS
jgi:hypothetical protein